jgi:hypothetical protein
MSDAQPLDLLALAGRFQADNWKHFRAAQEAMEAGNRIQSEYEQGKAAKATEAMSIVLDWAKDQGVDVESVREELKRRMREEKPEMLSTDDIKEGFYRNA